MKELFLVLFVFGFSEGRQYRYDYRYYSEADGWLKLHRVPAAWADARLRCSLEGAVLASPANIYIASSMRNEMKRLKVASDGVFVGVHSTFSPGDFYSIEGYPLNKMPVEWSPPEPDNKENKENCIALGLNGTIADVSCSIVLPYICHKKKTKNMELNECGTLDKEYNLDSRTGSCYKFHRIPRNWTRAFMACSAEGAYLAIPDTEAEATVLKELFDKNPPNTIPGKLHDLMRQIAHLGFHNWGENAVWTTIHGTPLVNIFHTFSEGQPDNASPGESCGSMWRNGRLNDVWCHEPGPFICEKSPYSLLDEDK